MNDALIGTDITGIYETHLPVRSLDRSIPFYRDKLGLTLATLIPERKIAFFWVGDKTQSMLGLWEAGSAPLHMVLHFAFRMPLEHVLTAPARLSAQGITPRGFDGTPVDEPDVIGWMPAASVYFKDPDGHSLEVISVLDAAPDADFGVAPYSDWQARADRG